jgi:hypothetical protein
MDKYNIEKTSISRIYQSPALIKIVRIFQSTQEHIMMPELLPASAIQSLSSSTVERGYRKQKYLFDRQKFVEKIIAAPYYQKYLPIAKPGKNINENVEVDENDYYDMENYNDD